MGDGEDRERLGTFLDGDREAFDELARSHRERIFRICYRYTGTREDADDLTQEVLVRAYRGLPRFRAEARLSTWLHRIAANVCLSWVASKKRAEVAGAFSPRLELVHPGPSPAETLSGAERADAVRRAVLELPQRQRLTLVLRIYEELTHREIAEAMDCPVGTSKANFFFALKSLRKKLVAMGFQP